MSSFRNTILHGDCIEVMQTMPARSVDFILTDPPYLGRFKSRGGLTLLNDDRPEIMKPAFAQMFRVLKRDAICVSFYGWVKADVFSVAMREAGFRFIGHIVFPKPYASKSRFLSYRHEAAYVLAKGRPEIPANPPPDVIPWTKYTGNALHPTQKPINVLKPLIEAFTAPGQLVLDPFAGSGSTCVAAKRTERDYVGIELDETHYATATKRLAKLT